jgi:hypothetical protein
VTEVAVVATLVAIIRNRTRNPPVRDGASGADGDGSSGIRMKFGLSVMR